MDRLQRNNPNDSIVDKGPILVGTEPPSGYSGFRTTLQIRHIRTNGDENEFELDAVINTEIRRGRRLGHKQTEEHVVMDHREISGLLLDSIAQARKGKGINDGAKDEE